MAKKTIIIIILLFFVFQQFSFAAEFRFSPRPNKAYLIQWRQWSPDAFEEAKKADKLILLALSAVWCHWCHVMDETTYSDPEVIDYINSRLIPVRVDADMRPDIDSLYNQGGWPSTVVLTHDGEPLQGGTYISQERMISWLSKSVELYASDKAEVAKRIEERREHQEKIKERRAAPDDSDIAEIVRIIGTSYDQEHGGFGASQKFPNPDTIDFLLAEFQEGRDPSVKTMITATLDGMAGGEIYDGTEGGFFRYATRPDWSAPHYEKMLGLNADLIGNYASAAVVLGSERYKKVVKEIVSYLRKNLARGPNGPFYGSQDADEDYYKGTTRGALKRPHVDDTIYADSNAQMITALVTASGAVGSEEYLRAAKETADFILKHLYSKKDGVFHYYRGQRRLPRILADNALFGLALIDLYNETGETRYSDRAKEIALHIMEKFYNPGEHLFIPSLGTAGVKPGTTGALTDYQSAVANYKTMIFMSRMYYLTGVKKMKRLGDEAAATFKNNYAHFAPAAALYGTALRWLREEPVRFTVVADEATAGDFLFRISRLFIPQKTVNVLVPSKDEERIIKLGYSLKDAVYACSGKVCSPAFTNPEELTQGIAKFLESLARAGQKGKSQRLAF